MAPRPRRLLSLLGLPPAVLRSLQEASLVHDEDVKDLNPTELREVSGLQLAECCEVLRLSTRASGHATSMSVLDMIEKSPTVSHIATFCSTLDGVLGGGFPRGAITEVAGTPGVGKTQLCLQVCVGAQVPEAVGGAGGAAVFIDSEGSFAASRLHEMAVYAVAHISRITGRQQNQREGEQSDTDCKAEEEQSHLERMVDNDQQKEDKDEQDIKNFTVENIMKNLHYFRCLNQLSLVACIKHLPAFLTSHESVRLVVVDSIAFHLRHDVPDNRVRMALLCALTQDLVNVATTRDIAVVVTNQMTTRIKTATNQQPSNISVGVSGAVSELVPALGETWGHCPTLRLVMRWQGGVRTATLTKAPHRPNGVAKFQITAAGIRDLPSVEDSENSEAATEFEEASHTSNCQENDTTALRTLITSDPFAGVSPTMVTPNRGITLD